MRHWRWAVVIGGVAALVSLPVVVAEWPVAEPDITVAELRDRVAASAGVAHTGLYESRGGLRLPNLGRFDDEVAPFTQRTRVRVWYAAPDRWRADELLIGAERGVYREPGGIWLWDSGTRRIVYSPRDSTEPLRIPRMMDLSPAELGRRLLADSGGDTVTAIDARRIAGQTAAGLRIVPASETTTIAAVDLWADPDTGVVLAVEIDTGGTAPAFETEFVDVAFDEPSPGVVTFDPTEVDVPVRDDPYANDVVEAVAEMRLVTLPDELAGLPRRNDPDEGIATYGDGLSAVSLLAVPQGTLGRPGRGVFALAASERPWGGQARVVSTSLVNVEVLAVDGFDVVLAGTVTVAELDRIAGELVEEGVL